MKKTGNKNLKIAAVSSMTIFSLFTVFVATYSWFTAARAVDNNADYFQVVCNSEIVEEIEIHTLVDTPSGGTDNPYLYDSTAVGTYQFDDPKTTKLTYHKNPDATVGIGTYSLFEREKSLLMLYKFRSDIKDDVFNRLVFKANNKTTEENSILRYDSTNKKPVKELGQDKNQLSSIIKFSALPLTTIPSTYDFSGSSATINDNAMTFATIDATKDEALTNYETSLTLLESTDGTKYAGMALILSYNADALEYLFNINLGNTVLDNVGDDNQILFDYVDFSLVL
jgi:hypothetical protein